MSWLGIDFGTKRSGVALSRSGQLAEPLELIQGDIEQQITRLIELIRAYDVLTVVVGVARRDLADHPTRVMYTTLKERLAVEFPKVDVASVDETLSTKEAERLAREVGRQLDTDLLAATLILEQYLMENSNDQISDFK